MAEVSLHQSLSQQQTLAPQMRQSLEILQANTLELSQLLNQAMVLNPVLEDVTENESFDEIVESERESEDDFDDWHETYQDDLRELSIMERRNKGVDHDAAERREHFYNSIVAPLTLQEHLMEQIGESGVPLKIRSDAEIVVGNLTDHGYLDGNLEDLAGKLQIPFDRLEDGLALVQSLDPPGVGARDLRECLLLQLDHLGLGNGLEAEIVDEHLDELARNHFPQIAKALHLPLERIAEVVEHIRALDPSPGSRFIAGGNPYIQPDIVISELGFGEYQASLTGSYLPRLRINDEYKDLLANTAGDRKTRNYLRDNIRDGRVIIKAIDQRQETILAIAREIIDRQSPFLEHGSRHLKPMTMNDIAEKIGVHPTTVSRAVAGKYIDTPHGLMEMRKFFATGYHTSDGKDVSNEGVRETLQSLVSNEDSAKPLSDSKLEKLLKEQGIDVARRTVAKYREQLGILPSHLRKKY
ncbi:MAG: RNA polymerase factor sigma-54 [Akkermansiaceae bacterium]|nr:RNA polymerase factor sigma-54 [Akkermansiaceae bacterium]MDG2323644.1 RNA polymerase factor sigma-54 [Akkermansiaceae bacterium]